MNPTTASSDVLATIDSVKKARGLTCVERQRDIENLINQERKLQVELLSLRFGVSEVTIRKDLTDLEKRGVLLRTHGGAVIAERPEMVVPIGHRTRSQLDEKDHIALMAATRVRDGESILLDTGSTTLALARRLRGRNLSVVTNSLLIALELAEDEHISVTVLGGTLRRSSLAVMGSLALEQLKNLHVDRAFMGASGFDPRTGFSSQNLIESETKRAMLQSAHEVVMCVDSSKFQQTAFAPFCRLKEVHCVITDAPPLKTTAEALHKARVELIVTSRMK